MASTTISFVANYQDYTYWKELANKQGISLSRLIKEYLPEPKVVKNFEKIK